MRAEEISAIASAWSEELSRALRERSAWAHLGKVEVTHHRGTTTLGGYIDRRSLHIPKAGPLSAVVDAWRKTNDGRIVDRAVVAANTALYARLDPASRIVGIDDKWLDEADAATPVDASGVQGRIVALGVPADLVALTRASLGSPARARLHACATDGKAGIATVVAGTTPPCTVVAVVSIAPGPDGLHVITVLDIKTRGPSRLARIDVRLDGRG